MEEDMKTDNNNIQFATGDRPILPEGTRHVPVYIMGKKYIVPETITIQKAIEFAGYKFIRACGCRGGICGACGTVYRKMGDFVLHFCLACQTVVEEDMFIAQIPFFPAYRANYDMERTEAAAETIMALYPEVMKCVGCNTCTKSCPMDIDVMAYINAAMRGDIAKVAKLSFDCIQCGLCTARCPAQIQHYHVAQLCRRLYGKYLVPKDKFLQERKRQILEGKYEEMLDNVKHLSREELEKQYTARETEPTIHDGSWMPKEKEYL
jgi:formate hydrogenlyase subunit 6/NADH:ubiquinone oxidoreductase subunit I